MNGDRLLDNEALEAIRKRAESKSGGAFDFLACARDDVHALLAHAEALAEQMQVRDAVIRDKDALIAGDAERAPKLLEAMKTLAAELDEARQALAVVKSPCTTGTNPDGPAKQLHDLLHGYLPSGSTLQRGVAALWALLEGQPGDVGEVVRAWRDAAKVGSPPELRRALAAITRERDEAREALAEERETAQRAQVALVGERDDAQQALEHEREDRERSALALKEAVAAAEQREHAANATNAALVDLIRRFRTPPGVVEGSTAQFCRHWQDTERLADEALASPQPGALLLADRDALVKRVAELESERDRLRDELGSASGVRADFKALSYACASGGKVPETCTMGGLTIAEALKRRDATATPEKEPSSALQSDQGPECEDCLERADFTHLCCKGPRALREGLVSMEQVRAAVQQVLPEFSEDEQAARAFAAGARAVLAYLTGAMAPAPEDVTAPQPPPTRAEGSTPVWPLILGRMRSHPPAHGDAATSLRIAEDAERQHLRKSAEYGTPLCSYNGRDALADAYQDALDVVAYTGQAALEAREDLEAMSFTLNERALLLTYEIRLVLDVRKAQFHQDGEGEA